MERTWSATLDHMEDMRQFILGAAEGKLSPRREAHLDLAVEEIVVNICSYAYEIPPGEITVRVEETEDSLGVEFIDNGVPFDPLAAEEPDVTRPLADRDQGGLGILLVRRVMDEVHYRREGGRNCLRIAVKKG
ncbi:MAG TPA: ATP-binding protein [Synergistaceae bacterium]|jgi:anti-sigma regulatory factor (Ser/Thr protein kinase)|nr:MAG: Serine/threonine-protein kinase BtrW [Synergistetes bacterium ADurb.Bin520]HOU32674.1 ATP-binding protein [Synergistaceae bacterium]HQF92262.1 ATP-binding protein [Synergistaceae bacterium]HQH79044.1 ATP-binding protein [Synergistaceae bacterium]